jgi:hypothetical protein
MPDPVKLEKAELRELNDAGKETQDKSHWVTVQFNPETLKVTFSNQVANQESRTGAGSGSGGRSRTRGQAGDQRGNSTIQSVGQGTTKLSLQLWFDVTGAQPQGGSNATKPASDVQELTNKVLYFITPQQDQRDRTKFKVPLVSFVWGTFQFDGVVESMDETFEFFSPDGKPLRASVSLGLTRQAILAQIRDPGGGKGATAAANAASPQGRAFSQAKSGDSVQNIASRQGLGSNWQDIARRNGIEDPLRLQPGRFLNLNAGLNFMEG